MIFIFQHFLKMSIIPSTIEEYFHKIEDTGDQFPPYLPQRATSGSAGYDLFSNEDCVLEPWSTQVIGTGIYPTFDDYVYGKIWPRSGLAAKFGIDTGAGVIDSDYRNEIRVVLFSRNQKITISKGDKIAQLCLEYRVCLDDDVQSSRNGGFGSTDS